MPCGALGMRGSPAAEDSALAAGFFEPFAGRSVSPGVKLIVATPCPKSWDEMAGSHRVRTCSECNLNVYNLAAIPRGEIPALIRKKEGRFCGRLYLLGDRKAATRDCPTGRDRLILRRVGTLVAVLLVAAFGWICRSVPGPEREQFPRWAQEVLRYVDPPPSNPTGCYITGVIVNPHNSARPQFQPPNTKAIPE